MNSRIIILICFSADCELNFQSQIDRYQHMRILFIITVRKMTSVFSNIKLTL